MTEIIMIIESRSSSSANKQYYLFTYVHKYQSLVQHKRMMHLFTIPRTDPECINGQRLLMLLLYTQHYPFIVLPCPDCWTVI